MINSPRRQDWNSDISSVPTLSSPVLYAKYTIHPHDGVLSWSSTRRPGENIVISAPQIYSGGPDHHDSPPPALMPSPACPVTPPFPPQLLRTDRGTGPSPCGQPGAVSERCARSFSVSCYFYGFVFGYAIPPPPLTTHSSPLLTWSVCSRVSGPLARTIAGSMACQWGG